jgi:aryl-alcohol dehydrogenase-like predicted oxidoreductase
MAVAPHIKYIFGTRSAGKWPEEDAKQYLEILKEYEVHDLDTARGYIGSEKRLQELGATKDFIIHTKAKAWASGALTKEGVLQSAKDSLEDLKLNQVETYFLHSPDPKTPITETLEAIQQLFKEGKFKYFGVSNYKPEQVQEIYDICTSKGYVLPTVYQGNYNAVARHYEEKLFPLLRKLNIRFMGYSPLAGGFLVRNRQQVEGNEGRFDKATAVGKIYSNMYAKQSLFEAQEEWENIANEAGISKAALANRWVVWNSALHHKYSDAIILGASTPKQLRDALRDLAAGPLEKKIADRIQKIWEKVKHEAPLDNYWNEYLDTH